MGSKDIAYQDEENIYGNEDIIRNYRALEVTPEKSGSRHSDRGHYRGATVIVGLLCGFLLTALAVMGFYYYRLIAERDHCRLDLNASQLISIERDQLQSGYETCKEEQQTLQMENERHRNCNIDKDLLQTRYETCKKEEKTLEEDKKRFYACALGEQICPKDWMQFRCRCYYMSDVKKSWHESRQYCNSRGADLMIIDDKKEHEFIHTLSYSTWIGLTDAESEGTWKWVDGTELNKDLAYWAPGQPDDYKKSEDCVESWNGGSNPMKRWNDSPCNRACYWICEKDIDPSSPK